MFPNIGPMEMMMLMGLGVLLFGKRLPEVGRSLGRGIVEFKKGLNGVGDEFSAGSSGRSSSGYGGSHEYDNRPAVESSSHTESAVPRFEVPGAVSTTAPTPGDALPRD